MLFNESLDGGAAVPCFAVRRLSTRLQNSADKMAEGRGQSQLAGTHQRAAIVVLSCWKLLTSGMTPLTPPRRADRERLWSKPSTGVTLGPSRRTPRQLLVLSTAAAKLKTVRVSNPDVVIDDIA